MAIITIRVAVPNLTEVMAQFDKLKIHRSTTGEAGPYSELTDATTRLALEAGKAIYSYTDTTGDDTYYYRSSYFNSVSLLESSLSDPQLGEGAGALDIMSVEELKTNYLFGLDLTNDEGTPYPDSLYEHFIISAVDKLETKLAMPIIPKTVEEAHDYYKEDYENYLWLSLDKYPVVDIESVKMTFPGDEVAYDYPREWFQLEADSGQLQLMPGSSSIGVAVMTSSSTWLPLLRRQSRFVPKMFRVKYTAGFEPGSVPPLIKDTIGKIASFGPLNIAGDLLGGAGIASQCLVGESTIKIEGIGEISISDYLDGEDRKLCRVWIGDSYQNAEVFKTGKKTVCHTDLENGLKLSTSPDHKFKTPAGFIRQEDLIIGEKVLCDGGTASDVRRLELSGRSVEMFDISVFHDSHQFAANGIIVHNSISIDGLSQNFNTTSSATNAGYGARLIQYQKELKESYKDLKAFYKRVNMVIG
jgi:hypothetical protein